MFARTYAPDWYRTYEGIQLPRERWAEADARWLQIYSEEACGLLAGASDALTRIAKAGVRAALVTSGSRARVEGDLVRLGLESSFSVVVCAEDARNKKPHPEALVVALARLGVPAPRAAYVGDSPEDIRMARAAGVFSVGIVGGFPNAAELRESSPDLLAADLAGALDALLAVSPAVAPR